MQINVTTTGSIFGAMLGVFINGLLYVILKDAIKADNPYLIMGIAMTVEVIVFYLIATATVKNPDGPQSNDEPAVTALMRGLLIGINSFANFSLLYLLFSPLNDTAGLVIGAVIGGINILASIAPLSQWVVYQGILGWANWVMPMSWLVVALGLAFVILSVILHPLGLLGVTFLRVGIPSDSGQPLAGRTFTVDWKTGTMSLYAGWIANLNYIGTAFNMGNFAFVHRTASSDHAQHEAGHTLNLAAFGSVFHLVGALDENLPGIGSGAKAFAEMLAESNAGSHDRLLMWD